MVLFKIVSVCLAFDAVAVTWAALATLDRSPEKYLPNILQNCVHFMCSANSLHIIGKYVPMRGDEHLDEQAPENRTLETAGNRQSRGEFVAISYHQQALPKKRLQLISAI